MTGRALARQADSGVENPYSVEFHLMDYLGGISYLRFSEFNEVFFASGIKAARARMFFGTGR